MGDKSGIAWTNATWNPITGCTKVSQGCKNCYAEREWPRLAANKKSVAYFGRAFTDIALHEDRLSQPLKWSKPRLIFVNSMSDLFHEDVPYSFVDKVFAIMGLTPRHTYQILTKRPDRMLEYTKRIGKHHTVDPVSLAAKVIDPVNGFMWRLTEGGFALPNVWLGVSVEDQATADYRIPLLLRTPAAVRWISAEPLLERVEIGFAMPWERTGPEWKQALDWVVVGGESGPNARPMHAEWLRGIQQECSKAGVPIFIKQLGANFIGPDDGLFGAIASHVTAKTYNFGHMKNRAGSDMNEWPRDLKVREWPNDVVTKDKQTLLGVNG